MKETKNWESLKQEVYTAKPKGKNSYLSKYCECLRLDEGSPGGQIVQKPGAFIQWAGSKCQENKYDSFVSELFINLHVMPRC